MKISDLGRKAIVYSYPTWILFWVIAYPVILVIALVWWLFDGGLALLYRDIRDYIDSEGLLEVFTRHKYQRTKQHIYRDVFA
jgi:hypothetical protein